MSHALCVSVVYVWCVERYRVEIAGTVNWGSSLFCYRLVMLVVIDDSKENIKQGSTVFCFSVTHMLLAVISAVYHSE